MTDSEINLLIKNEDDDNIDSEEDISELLRKVGTLKINSQYCEDDKEEFNCSKNNENNEYHERSGNSKSEEYGLNDIQKNQIEDIVGKSSQCGNKSEIDEDTPVKPKKKKKKKKSKHESKNNESNRKQTAVPTNDAPQIVQEHKKHLESESRHRERSVKSDRVDERYSNKCDPLVDSKNIKEGGEKFYESQQIYSGNNRRPFNGNGHYMKNIYSTRNIRNTVYNQFEDTSRSKSERDKYLDSINKKRNYEEDPLYGKTEEFKKYTALERSKRKYRWGYRERSRSPEGFGVCKNAKFILREVEGDLFTCEEAYSLAHCVAQDFCMGAGIAVQFRLRFGRVDELLEQNKTVGEVAVLKKENRFIFYLVTKKLSPQKPTCSSMFEALRSLKMYCLKLNVQKLAIPRIGCGLDRLSWYEVKKMLNYVFQDLDMEIVVYNYVQQKNKLPPENRSDNNCINEPKRNENGQEKTQQRNDYKDCEFDFSSEQNKQGVEKESIPTLGLRRKYTENENRYEQQYEQNHIESQNVNKNAFSRNFYNSNKPRNQNYDKRRYDDCNKSRGNSQKIEDDSWKDFGFIKNHETKENKKSTKNKRNQYDNCRYEKDIWK